MHRACSSADDGHVSEPLNRMDSSRLGGAKRKLGPEITDVVDAGIVKRVKKTVSEAVSEEEHVSFKRKKIVETRTTSSRELKACVSMQAGVVDLSAASDARRPVEAYVGEFEKIVQHADAINEGEWVRKQAALKEILFPIVWLCTQIEEVQHRKYVLEQIFCRIEEVDLIDKMTKLIGKAEAMLKDRSGKAQLERLSTLLASVEGILGPVPKGHIYHFRKCGSITLPPDKSLVREEPVGLDSGEVDRLSLSLYPMVCDANRELPPTPAVSLRRRPVRVCWMWGDLWSPASHNPLRWSSWFDITDAVRSLRAEAQQNRQVVLCASNLRGKVFHTVHDVISAIEEYGAAFPTPGNFKWMWGDLNYLKQKNPARWSCWMTAADTETNIRGFLQSGHSRPIRLVSRTCKRFLCVQEALEFLSNSANVQQANR